MNSSEHIKSIHVNYCRGQQLVPFGKLLWKDKRIYFEYNNLFLESGLHLSPFKLPLKPGVILCEDHVFNGLFGLFNDSLPDGWGRLLLDRKMRSIGLNPDGITPLDRLSYTGSRGMGALQYEPEINDSRELKLVNDLDEIAQECMQVIEYDDNHFLDDLLIMNGSSAGARPKILIAIQPKEQIVSNNNLNEIHNDWIVKFRSSIDPKDSGSIEYAYNLMAKSAGLDIPEINLFKSKIGSGHFGVKRFDRVGSKFIHMHTVCGLLHADHRYPALDYFTIMKVTMLLTKNQLEVERQYRNAAFNVFAHNRDDHSKNFSFLMDEDGSWRVSPAYDLTFSSGPGGEHCTSVMGEGRAPAEFHLLKLAKAIGIPEKISQQIIEEVKSAVMLWPAFAKEANVSVKSLQFIYKQLKM
ncbi:MAG: type II toxin-antitoxin system HipA family toxin [Parachlamydiaceae bacterium]|nr:type II toxin-antitoxin system HipA family toxin [Parachlamydiaceae bacterium]